MQYFFKTLMVILTFSLIFTSCSEPEQELEDADIGSNILIEYDASNISSASLEEQVEYTRLNLQIIGKYVSRDLRNGRSQDALLQQINNRPDRFDNDILAMDFFDGIERNSLNLNAKENEELNDAINAFNNIDGINYLPQLYVPFFENRIRDINTERSLNSPLIITPVVEESGLEAFMGYYENEDGQFIESGIFVDEEYAENNLVIVIGTGGTDFDGNQQRCPGDDQGNGNTGGGDGTPPPATRIKVNNMKVKQHKEDWHNGKSEVEYVSIDVNKNSNEVVVNQDPNNINDIRFRKFSRSEVRNESNISIQRTVNFGASDNESYLMTIFERDGFPAPIQTSDPILVNGIEYVLIFRSWQSEYDTRKFDKASQNLNRNNMSNGIEYSTQLF